jgi:hypothetical protein
MISIHSKAYSSIQISEAASTTPSTPAETTTRFADQFQEVSQPNTPPSSTVVPGPVLPELTATASPAPQPAADKTEVSAAVKNFIEWQGAQPSPFGQGTISDIWAKQGITDPMSNPILIGQAETQLNRAEQRSAMNPNYVAEWKGDWKTQMAHAKAAENQRQTFLAAADALGKVTVGGGIVSMVG